MADPNDSVPLLPLAGHILPKVKHPALPFSVIQVGQDTLQQTRHIPSAISPIMHRSDESCIEIEGCGVVNVIE